MDKEPEDMTEEEKAQMFGAMVEDGEVKEMGQEEWQNLMPNRSPTLRERAIGGISVLVMIALITSPIWVYLIEGFEIAIVVFLTVYLLVLTQSS